MKTIVGASGDWEWNDESRQYIWIGPVYETTTTSSSIYKSNLEAFTPTSELIDIVCAEIRDLLQEKNKRYGDSALVPLRVFSKADPLEQLRVRIDDKLSRIVSAQLDDDEDVINDLIGYLILYKVAMRKS